MAEPTVTVLETLTLSEESDRLRLERKVEKAFYVAGASLRELRDRKLYRSTHSTFSEYCQERFGFGKSSVYYLIASVEIVDNLKKSPLLVEKLPTSETQCRPLKSLEPQQQQEAWHLAVEKARGRVPSAKVVKEVVNQIKAQELPPSIEDNNGVASSKAKTETRFVPLENPTIGQRVRISSKHSLFGLQQGTITQLPNYRSAIVQLDNQQRELIDLKDLEMQRLVQSNGKVTTPREGLNYTPGLGNEYYVRLQEETWKKLNDYAEEMGVPTLNGAIERLLSASTAF